MLIEKDDNGWITIRGPLTKNGIRSLSDFGEIDTLSISDQSTLTVPLANELALLPGIEWLHIWCGVTRAAMRAIARIKNLKIIDILEIRAGGSFDEFNVPFIERFYSTFMSESDLLAITKSKNLKQIHAQDSDITENVTKELLKLPNLQYLDLESSNLNDDSLKMLCKSESLTSLELGATDITGNSLKHISNMKQLESLDLWATQINVSDLDVLADMPKLKYLSVGGIEDHTNILANDLIPKLYAIKSLKNIWLDGIHLSNQQQSELEARFESVKN